MADKLLLQDGASFLLLQDGASRVLLAGGAAGDQTLNVSFITGASVVYAPTLSPGAVNLSIAHIPSTAIVYTPTLSPGAIAGQVPLIPGASVAYAPTLASDTALRGRIRSSRMVKLRQIEEERQREAAERAAAAPAPQPVSRETSEPSPSEVARVRAHRQRTMALGHALDLTLAADLAAQMALLDWLAIAADVARAAELRAQAEAVLALKIGIEAVNDRIALEIARQTALADAVLEELAVAEQMIALQMQALRDDEEDAMALLLMAA